MNNIPETINNVLEVLSTKFGTSVDHLWQVMVQQQIYEGRAHLVMGIIALIVVSISIFFMVRYAKEEKDFDITMLFLIIGMVILIIPAIFFYEAYMEFINPEYQAIVEFLGVIKGE